MPTLYKTIEPGFALNTKQARILAALNLKEHAEAHARQGKLAATLAEIFENGGDPEISLDKHHAAAYRRQAGIPETPKKKKPNTELTVRLLTNVDNNDLKHPVATNFSLNNPTSDDDASINPDGVAIKPSLWKRFKDTVYNAAVQTKNFIYAVIFTSAMRFWLLGWFTSTRLFFSRLNRVLLGLHAGVNNDITWGSLGKAPFLAAGGLSYGFSVALDLATLFKNTFFPSAAEKHLKWTQRFINTLYKDERLERMANDAPWFAINLAALIVSGGILNIIGFAFDLGHEIYKARKTVKEHNELLDDHNKKIAKIKRESFPDLSDEDFNQYQTLIINKTKIQNHISELSVTLAAFPYSIELQNEKSQLSTQLVALINEIETNRTRITGGDPSKKSELDEYSLLHFRKSKLEDQLNVVKDNSKRSIHAALGILAGFIIILFPQTLLFVAAASLLSGYGTEYWLGKNNKWTTRQKVFFTLGVIACIAALCFPPATFATSAVIIFGAALALAAGSIYGGFGNRVRNSWLGTLCANAWDGLKNRVSRLFTPAPTPVPTPAPQVALQTAVATSPAVATNRVRSATVVSSWAPDSRLASTTASMASSATTAAAKHSQPMLIPLPRTSSRVHLADDDLAGSTATNIQPGQPSPEIAIPSAPSQVGPVDDDRTRAAASTAMNNQPGQPSQAIAIPRTPSQVGHVDDDRTRATASTAMHNQPGQPSQPIAIPRAPSRPRLANIDADEKNTPASSLLTSHSQVAAAFRKERLANQSNANLAEFFNDADDLVAAESVTNAVLTSPRPLQETRDDSYGHDLDKLATQNNRQRLFAASSCPAEFRRELATIPESRPMVTVEA